VCRDLTVVARQQAQRLVFLPGLTMGDSNRVASALKHRPGVSQLILKSLSQKDVSVVVSALQQLEHEGSPCLKNVTSLGIEDEPLGRMNFGMAAASWSTLLPRVEKLSFIYVDLTTAAAHFRSWSGLTNLACLTLNGCIINDDAIKEVVNLAKLATLKDLSIYMRQDPPDARSYSGLWHALGSLTALHSLTLRAEPASSKDFAHLTALTALTYLCWKHYCGKSANKALKRWLPALVSLQYLALPELTLQDGAWRAWQRCSS